MALEVFSPKNPLYREIIKGVEFVCMYEGSPIKFCEAGIYILDTETFSEGRWLMATTDEYWRIADALRVGAQMKYIELTDLYLAPAIVPMDG